MAIRFSSLLDDLRARLWLTPAVFVLLAIGLSRLSLYFDDHFQNDVAGFTTFPGGPDSARSFLSSIASSMITFTGVVFSVTILVLQLASNQLSPRVMCTFLRDWVTQLLLAFAIGTFVFTLLVLRQVSGGDSNSHGPSTWISLLLTIVTIGLFIYIIDHMAHSIRSSTVIERIGGESVSAINRLYPQALQGLGRAA